MAGRGSAQANEVSFKGYYFTMVTIFQNDDNNTLPQWQCEIHPG